MKFLNPLDVVAYYLNRDYSVLYIDTDPDRLADARKLRLSANAVYRVLDGSRPSSVGQSHYDICIGVNTDEFEDTHQEEWLSYGYQSIEFYV